jgi:hypothetical protein
MFTPIRVRGVNCRRSLQNPAREHDSYIAFTLDIQ